MCPQFDSGSGHFSLKMLKEDAIIQLLQNRFTPPANYLGIGDDCAVFPDESEGFWLVTTDSMVEGTHFLRDKISMEDLGYKLAMVNFSDIAAMGGSPHSVYLSCALPSDFLEVKNIFEGVKEALDEVSVPLLGGDVVKSRKNLFLSMTVLGKAQQIKKRSGGKPGDILCVTGFLGDSAAGLRQLLHSGKGSLIEKHIRPRAHLKEGKRLAGCGGVGAMMDLSDGLHVDVQRLAKASGCGAKIFLDKLPISHELRSYAEDEAEDLAVSGGEDYCLLAAADAGLIEQLPDLNLHAVGELTAEAGTLVYLRNGEPAEVVPHPFEHF